ncbi:MAG: hypothetical protein JWR21_864 [Herminiimonas sp.]|nr:hypothetical protein [Herminiimonas sp.]
MDEEAIEVSRFPQWRQAVQDCLREFKYGDLIPHDWLADRFGIPTVDEDESVTVQEFRERQFEWLANIEAFKGELLRDHQICLQSVRGEGFRWVPPQEQTRIASEAFERDAGRAFRNAGQKLRNVRIAELTDDQRRENLDAVAKLTAVRGMHRGALK